MNLGFLQETHSDVMNEIDWGLWWGEQQVLSHGTSVSAGVTILLWNIHLIQQLTQRAVQRLEEEISDLENLAVSQTDQHNNNVLLSTTTRTKLFHARES